MKSKKYGHSISEGSFTMKAVTFQGVKDIQVKVVPDATIQKPDDI